MLSFRNTLGVIFGAEMNTVWLAKPGWGVRNIDFQSVRLAGLQPADWEGSGEQLRWAHRPEAHVPPGASPSRVHLQVLLGGQEI
jgi:hypothetical protein